MYIVKVSDIKKNKQHQTKLRELHTINKSLSLFMKKFKNNLHQQRHCIIRSCSHNCERKIKQSAKIHNMNKNKVQRNGNITFGCLYYQQGSWRFG